MATNGHHQMCRVAMSYNADQEMEAEEVKAESNACESLQLGFWASAGDMAIIGLVLFWTVAK